MEWDYDSCNRECPSSFFVALWYSGRWEYIPLNTWTQKPNSLYSGHGTLMSIG